MPAQAFGESKYFAGVVASKICDKEHATAPLWDSEMFRVQHSPRDVTRPAVPQFSKHAGKVPAFKAAVETGNIFTDKVSRSKFSNNSCEFIKKSAALACESGAETGHR